jgi:hypothetical protein
MPVLAIFSDLTISGNKVALRFLNHSLRLPTSSSSTSPSPNRNISSKWRNPNLRYQNWCRTHRSGLPTSSLVCSSVATAAMRRTAPTGANRRTGLYTSICEMPLVCLGQDLVLLTIVASTFLLEERAWWRCKTRRNHTLPTPLCVQHISDGLYTPPGPLDHEVGFYKVLSLTWMRAPTTEVSTTYLVSTSRPTALPPDALPMGIVKTCW